uniref:Uncharacterized protein n=1 Tax=Arundo donax TaxID=35708 RepID=A0A0A9H4I4_ARUDO
MEQMIGVEETQHVPNSTHIFMISIVVLLYCSVCPLALH